MAQLIDRFLTVSTTRPRRCAQEEILNILLAGTAGSPLLAILIVAYIASTSRQDPPETSLIFWGSIATLVGVILISAVNIYWSGRVAAFMFLLFLSLIFTFSDTPEQVASGRALFMFTIPIFMASILLIAQAQVLSLPRSAVRSSLCLRYSIGFAPNYPAIIGFFLLAFVSWLSARSLEQALSELRAINANLDQVVAERTQALAESLTRERIEAGRNQAILNSIADGVIVFDKKWNATLANPAVKAMLEIPLELIVNKNFRELIEHPRLSPKSRDLLIRHDGTRHPAHWVPH